MSFSAYSQYKDSGVEWLGKVPAEWDCGPIRRGIEEIAERNWDEQSSDYLSLVVGRGVIPYAEKGDVGNKKPEDLSKCKIVARGDFVLNSMNFGIGAFGRSSYDGVCSPVYVVMRAKPGELLPEIFAYLMQISALQRYAQSFGNGILAHRAAIGWDELKGLRIAYPPIPDQRVIAAFLDRETAKIDAAVAAQQRLIALLGEKRAATISQAVTKGLVAEVPMKDSGIEWLGQIPAHWGSARMRHLVAEPLAYGANEPADQDNPDNPRYVRITDMKSDGSLRATTFRSLPEALAAPYRLSVGDILLARSGATVGKSALVRNDWGACCHAGYLIRCRPDKTKVIPAYLFAYLQSDAFWAYIRQATIQSTIQNVSAERYSDLPIPLPSKNEQSLILEALAPSLDLMARAQQRASVAIALLKERRSALISAAVTGKIDVRGEVAAQEQEAA